VIVDPFATLGLSPRYAIDLGALERRYRELQRVVHPDRHGGGTPSERRLHAARTVEVNEAYRALKDDVKRAEALLSLHGVAADPNRRESPELLMEVLELREALSEARAARDLPRVRKLAEGVTTREREARAQLVAAFEVLSGGGGDATPAGVRAVSLLGQLKYLRRFLDEVASIEEEAES
jgi:molecular chaperone HscB